MDQDLSAFAHMIAAEKMSNLLFTIEITMQYMEEYLIKPDDEVKKALIPKLDQMRKWLDNG